MIEPFKPVSGALNPDDELSCSANAGQEPLPWVSCPTDEEYVRRARESYVDDDVQIDHEVEVARSEYGAFVRAWVWVPRWSNDA